MRVLGRVERFGGKLQVQVRTVETAEDTDPASLTPSMRRDADSTASSSSWPPRSRTKGLPRSSTRSHATSRSAERSGRSAASADGHHGYAGGLLEHTVGVATLCRETAQLHPRLRSRHRRRGRVARRRTDPRARPRPAFRQTDEGRLLGHVHLGLRMIEERGRDLDPPSSPSFSTRSRAITIAPPPEPPKQPSSTTRTSSTRKQLDAPLSATTDGRGLVLALAGSFGWGVGDFLGGLAARRLAVSPCSRSRRQSDSSAFWSGRSSPETPSRASRRSCPQRVAASRPWSGWARSTATPRDRGRWESSPRSRPRPGRPTCRRWPAAWFERAAVARRRFRRRRDRDPVTRYNAMHDADCSGCGARGVRRTRVRAVLRRHRRRGRRGSAWAVTAASRVGAHRRRRCMMARR